MAVILLIETATPVCSAAIAKDGQLVAIKETDEDKSHAKRLAFFIKEMQEETKMQIDAYAVSKGPGSYTGLRIGVSTAKGMAYASDKQLIAVSTLQAMAEGIALKIKKGEIKNISPDAVLCPMIDARRMEVYTACYSQEGEEIKSISAEIIDENFWKTELQTKQHIFFGNGADKCKEIIKNPNAIFIDDITPSAAYMAMLAEKAYREQKFEDIAYFEPFYLKDFVATTPKNKVISK